MPPLHPDMPPPRRWRRRSATLVALAAAGVTASAGAATAATIHPLPPMPVNACHDSTLPKDFGTNFPTPSDPLGFGFANETAIGWENNIYAPFEYLSGSYFARGVPTTYAARGQTLCGGMYSFGAYTWGLPAGQAPAPGSVHWSEANNYLPAMTTSFTRNDVTISITDFANKQTIAGQPTELVYTRIKVANHGSSAVDVAPDASGPNLVALNQVSDTVAPGKTAEHDFVAAVDTFDTTSSLPTVAQLTPSATTPGAQSYNAAYRQMTGYWNARLQSIPALSLPNVPLPHTHNLKNPGIRMTDAYKAAFIYTRMVQAADAPFSAANNYAYLLDHDAPGILANRFELGDFTDAQSLLLNARISAAPNFNEQGANWYWDGPWRTPIAWAEYLQGTGDVSFVKQWFHDDAGAAGQFGPSLFTIMHTDFESQLNSSGYLKTSFDNDSSGTWLFDDETALAGMAAYQYIANRIGDTAEAQWASNAYNSLLSAINTGLATNEQNNEFDFLPCEVNIPVSQDRCSTANDANWAGSNLWGQNVWDIFLQGGKLDGILGDPSQTDNLYQTGFSRLDGSGVPFPSFGAYPGYSVALNTAYSQGALYGNAFRTFPITSYAWQIGATTGGPNAWWEANGSAPDPNNPWAGSHAAPQFGASPYTWPMAGQTETLLQSIAAPGMSSTPASDGGFDYTTDLYIGRGVPDQWIKAGKTISVGNLTAAYDETTGQRTTYGVQIATTSRGGRTVDISLTGAQPTGKVLVQLPVFADAGVQSASGGTYDAATHTLTMTGRTASILLGDAVQPTLTVHVNGNAPGSFAGTTLLNGTSTTVSAKIANTGTRDLTAITFTPQLRRGWTATALTPTTVASLAPHKSATARWKITPPVSATPGAVGSGVVVDASYSPVDGAADSTSAESWVTTQDPLPAPGGSTDLAPQATPSASSTSPWATVNGINSGQFPVQSSDDANLTPYWGDWPAVGTHWVELDWKTPITTNSSAVYFADDGGGLRVPSTWVVQFWNGSAWQNVANQSGQPTAINQFNWVTFDSVTTTKLRVQMQSNGGASVGVVQWDVPSAWTLPLPAGTTDGALTATPTASATAPGTAAAAVNNGVFPVRSADDSHLTPFWSDGQSGEGWVELDWTSPITTSSSEVFFADDGGAITPPSSWKVQYWAGSAWADVSGQSAAGATDDMFNTVTFDPVTTTKLRIDMQSQASSSVGIVQWVVPVTG